MTSAKKKIGYLAGFAVCIGIAYWLGIPCIWRTLLHIPCPGCGMTRACLAVLRGEFAVALAHHGMVWSLPLMLWCYMTEGEMVHRRSVNYAIMGVLVIGFLLNWIYSLVFR